MIISNAKWEKNIEEEAFNKNSFKKSAKFVYLSVKHRF